MTRKFIAYLRVAILPFVQVATIAWLLIPGPAAAQFYVRQPDTEKGIVELEEHGAFYSGPGEDERLRQSHEVEAKYGLTDRTWLIVEGFFEQPIGESLQFEEFEVGGQYELKKREGDGFGLAFRTIYEATRDGADEILFGPLGRYVWGRNSTTLNTFFVGQLGSQAEIDSLEFQYNWQLKRELSRRLSLGVEAFGEIEDLSHPGSFNDQLHRLGPVVYLNFRGEEDEAAEERETREITEPAEAEFKLAGGLLFGLTDATSDVTYKLDAELEF